MSGSIVAVWAAIALLAASLVGVAAGLLTWWDTRSVPRAVLVGGGAAGGTLTLALAAGALFQPE